MLVTKAPKIKCTSFRRKKLLGQKLIILSLLFFISLFLPSVSFAATYYIDAINGNDGDAGTNSSPWRTIDKAESSVVNGSTVYLRSGNYGEVTISRMGLSRNSWADGVTYIAEHSHTPVFSCLIIKGPENRYLTFKNVGIIVPSDSSYDVVVSIKSSSHIKLINCAIMGRWDETGANLTTYGVFIDENGDILIDGCDVQNADMGIKLNYHITGDVTVRNSHIHKMASTLISVGSGQVLIENNHLHDRQKVGDAHGSGIAVRTSNLTIRGNIIHDFGGSGGIRFYGVEGGHENIIIENNLIYDAQGTTNQYFGSIKKNITVRNNTFISWDRGSSGTYKYGGVADFSGSGASDVFVYNNVFVGIVGVDPSISNFDENNNIFWAFQYGKGNFLDKPLGNNSIIVYGNDNYFESSENFFVGGALFNQYSYTRGHKQNLNDAYKLADGSDAIGFANPAYAPATDLLGNPRDAHPDAGCYEYISGPPDTTPPSTP